MAIKTENIIEKFLEEHPDADIDVDHHIGNLLRYEIVERFAVLALVLLALIFLAVLILFFPNQDEWSKGMFGIIITGLLSFVAGKKSK